MLMVSFLLCPILVKGHHVVGGNISMTQQDNIPGKYVFTLNLYVNEKRLTVNEAETMADETLYLMIFSKKTNELKKSVPIKYRRFEKVIYDNIACEQALGLTIRNYTYDGPLTLNVSEFTDDEGYYVAFERCCRERDIINIENADQAALVFYMEFPSLTQYSKFSSPRFPTFKGEFICKDTPLEFQLKGIDNDGDQLAYSLVTPLNGHNDPVNTVREAQAAPYVPVKWKSPWSQNSIIIGTQPLVIDRNTGKMKVKAGTTGIYVFAIKVEKIRNGKVIGYNTIDYQILIAPCPNDAPPKPLVTINNKPGNGLVSCDKVPVTLQTEDDNDWVFQWMKDGQWIPDKILNRINPDESGTYSVMKNKRNVCSQSSFSEDIKIQFVTTQKPDIIESAAGICDGEEVTLKITPEKDFNYYWERNGTAYQTGELIKTKTGGIYTVYGESTTLKCPSLRDSIQLAVSSKPVPPVISQLSYYVCTGQSTAIKAGEIKDVKYKWYLNNNAIENTTINQLAVTQAGIYEVEYVNAQNCSAMSGKIEVLAAQPTLIDLSPMEGACASSDSLELFGPLDGSFSGKGILKNYFYPKIAGEGIHQISFTHTSAEGCISNASTTITVLPAIQLKFTKTYRVFNGTPVKIDLKSVPENLIYAWSPTESLDNPALPNPIAKPNKTTTYIVTVSDNKGCTATDSVHIVVDFSLKVPNIFSPNGDGTNDIWEIFNLREIYPEAEVYVYNSWGEIIFHQKKNFESWDGRYNNSYVPASVYQYMIVTHKNNIVLDGRLTVIN